MLCIFDGVVYDISQRFRCPFEVEYSKSICILHCSHIEFVMECLRNNTTEIRNMKQYLLAVLFNAPTTISNHYTAQVNHDMYAGGW